MKPNALSPSPLRWTPSAWRPGHCLLGVQDAVNVRFRSVPGVGKMVDIGAATIEGETITALEENDIDSVDRLFAKSVRNIVGFVELESGEAQIVVVHNGSIDRVRPYTLSWVPV